MRECLHGLAGLAWWRSAQRSAGSENSETLCLFPFFLCSADTNLYSSWKYPHSVPCIGFRS